MLFNFAGTVLRSSFILVSLLMLCRVNCALADLEFPEELPSDDTTSGAVTSIEAFNSIRGNATGSSLQLAAKYASSHGNTEEAIKWCKLALEKDPDDIDSHMYYAEALEAKLKSKPAKERDHDLLMQCVMEWMIVYRCEAGDEKGASFHGINPLGHLYEDEERSIPARHHIVSLVGRAPKPWETDDKFMKWVNRPSTAVAGKLISTKPVTATDNAEKTQATTAAENHDIKKSIAE